MKISIEGLIGAGKSTFARSLARVLNAHLLVEPDEKTDNPGGHNPYLADYYSKPEEVAFAMQVHLMTLRAAQAEEAEFRSKRGEVVVSDRSLPGDLAFARLQRRLGILSAREFDTYCRAYRLNLDRAGYPDVVFHLVASPTVCLQRVSKRMESETGRKCESGLTEQYLRALDAEVFAVLHIMKGLGTRVVQLDANEEITDHDEHAARKWRSCGVKNSRDDFYKVKAA